MLVEVEVLVYVECSVYIECVVIFKGEVCVNFEWDV